MTEAISLKEMDDGDLAELLAQELRTKGHSVDFRGNKLHIFWLDMDSSFKPSVWKYAWGVDRVKELAFFPETDGSAYGEYLLV